MKKLIVCLLLLFGSASLFAQEPLMKVYLQDGNYKTYNINEIEEMSFTGNPDFLLMCI